MSLSSVRSQGLRNLGNTCFLNAVLQSLTSIKSFRKYLENRNSKFSHKLARTLQEIEEGDEVVETKDLINLGLKSKFRWLEQHDAQELFHHLMQVLEEEKKASLFDLDTTVLDQRGEDDAVSITSLFKVDKDGHSISFARDESPPATSDEEECFSGGSSSCDEDVGSPLGSSLPWFCNDYEKNPFTGLVQNMLTCASCENIKYRYERFLDLHLQPTHKTTCIQQLLQAYSQFQKIEDYACGKCCIGHCSSENLSSSSSSSSSSASSSSTCSCAHHHKRVNCYSKVTMGRLPTALCLTLNRLATNEHFIYKRNTMIKYPVMLDMAPYWSFSERSDSAAAVSSRTIKSSLTATTNIRLKYSPDMMSTSSSAASSSIESSIKAYTMYELQAVIVHHGGIDGASGHFTTFRRDPCGGWVHTSDDTVVKVTEDCVLTQPAYMLFYEKKGMYQ